MAIDGRAARSALWQRYDDGGLTVDELDARLRAVDRAGDDPDALQLALDGPLAAGGSRRRTITVGVGIGAVVIAVALSLGATDSGGGASQTTGNTAGNGPNPPITVAPVPLPPGVLPESPDCPELDDFLAQFEGIDQDTPAANPALLSSPAAVPEGYSVSDQEDVLPGNDPDIAMSTSAGNPPPVQILARSLAGELPVTMRAWVYESAEAAAAAATNVAALGVCSYDLDAFDVPDRPEINGSVVSGPIPTTAFAGWRLAERRFSVAVVTALEGDEAATEAARQLAGTIAALELDAARTPPPPG